MKHLKELDGIRAIAALMVMWFHFFQHYPANSSLVSTIQKTAIFGQTGVSLFFVLSGFLITRILLNTKNSPDYFKSFYARRAVRIFPLYYLFLIIYFIILPLIYRSDFIISGVATGHFIGFSQQIYYWTYLQGFAMTFHWPNEGPNHYWSLAVEEHFYLFWPILIYFIKKNNLLLLCLGTIVFSVAMRMLLQKQNYDTFYFTYARFDELSLGALLAIVEVHNLLKSKYNTYYWLLLALSFGPLALAWKYLSGSSSATLEIVKPVLLGVVYFALLGAVITADDKNLIKKLLRAKPLVFIGSISYGLYIYHKLCFVLFHRYIHIGNAALDLLACFSLTVLISFLSYRFFEARFLRLKKYFAYKNIHSEVFLAK